MPGETTKAHTKTNNEREKVWHTRERYSLLVDFLILTGYKIQSISTDEGSAVRHELMFSAHDREVVGLFLLDQFSQAYSQLNSAVHLSEVDK